MQPSATSSVGSRSETFGWVFTVTLVVPGVLVVMTFLFEFNVRPEQWSPAAIYASFAVSISFLAAVIPVAVATNRLARRRGSRTGRNIIVTAVGVLALLPPIFIFFSLAISLIRFA